MRYQSRPSILRWSVILVLAWLMITTGSCHPPQLGVRIQNETDMTLNLFWVNYPRGDIARFAIIKPGEAFTHMALWDGRRYSILAVNERGNTVYSGTFNRQELDDIDWIVVIEFPGRHESDQLPIPLTP
ncbi:hypothetical protein ACFLT8_02415 [Chloroflexota bacterium]